MTRLGPDLVEELLKLDDAGMTMTYKMTKFGPLPIVAYEATMTVAAAGSKSTMTYDGSAVYVGPLGANDTVPFLGKDTFGPFVEVIYNGCIDAAVALCASPAPAPPP